MLKSKNHSFLVQKTHGFLKSELHVHTHEDLYDFWLVKYSAKDLIRLAAKQKYEALSITNHSRVFFNESLRSFAKKKGILLIPGAEPRIEGKDVIVINATNDELRRIKKLKDMEKIQDSALIIAPHPYFLMGNCLEDKLVKYIDRFHAIEFSHFYTRALLNPFFKFIAGNAKALAVAEKYNKPVVGTSDAHKLYEFGHTYTMVNSAKRKDDIIDAVKRNRIKMVTEPMPMHLYFKRMFGAIIKEGIMERMILKKKIAKKRHAMMVRLAQKR
jgi:predicted metal-dependent phosphoesterase TrpH